MSNGKETRPLYLRAKFAGPMWCGIGIIGIFIYSVWALPDLEGGQLKAIEGVVHSVITALFTLGVTIGGGATVHDASRDWGSQGNPRD